MNEIKTVEDIDTPLMNQYKSIKSEYRDAILFFRLGDFYEMFDDDAKIASRILGLYLTKRQGVLMCGVPYHSAMSYISKLINNGYKVAICEQVGEEDKKTKLFKRKVVRVITPGTVVEEELLNSKSSNYLCAVVMDIVGWGVSWIDVSTTEFFSINKLDDKNLSHFFSLISRISPREIICDKKTFEYFKNNHIDIFSNITVSEITETDFPFKDDVVWKNNNLAYKSVCLCLSYLKSLETDIKNLKPIYYDDNITLKLDDVAIKTLELVSSDYEGGYSLFDVIDGSKTAMGSRLVRKWILNPLNDIYLINKRLDGVDFLYRNDEIREKISNLVSKIPDIERVCGRIINLSINPHDLISLKNSIKWMDELLEILSDDEVKKYFGDVLIKLNSLEKLKKLYLLIDKSIDENSSLKVGEGNLFKKGYNQEYDELKNLIENSQSIISDIEKNERERTQIPSLKIGYNNNFGYYIEVTKTHLSKVPSNYIRKQTLVSSERFITPELKSIEEKILGATEKIQKLESYLFGELKKEVLLYLEEINIYSGLIAYIDALCGFATISKKNNYVKPEIVKENVLILEEARHPVVEKYLAYSNFVPNDLTLDKETRTIILTGPNMSGKSVYLRQTALIVIMAQIGCFVPCDKAKIGLVDRIMTRIGAHDRLVRGESTFMVEMKETANILKLATDRSLILLDEIGRGTSTFDGISIAYAVCEYIHKRIKAKVLFATHFFEITELGEKYEGIENYNIAVKEWVNNEGKVEIAFLHKVVKGPCDRSYGIHVAEIAGLPDECIKRAREILLELEKRNVDKKFETNMLPFPDDNPVIERLKMVDTNNITPIQALNILNELKKLC